MDAKTSSKLLSSIQANDWDDENDNLQLNKIDLSGASVAVRGNDEDDFVYDEVTEDIDGIGMTLDPEEERAMAAFASAESA